MSEIAERNGRRIHYTDTGSGPAVMLVPGLGGGSRTFGTLPRRFARHGLRCLSVDPVGMPPSGALSEPFAFDAAAQDLIAVLDAAKIDNCAFIGTSLGGKVSLTAAALAPERASHLVMLASSARTSGRALRVYRFFEIVAQTLDPKDFAEAVAPFLFGRTFHHERPAVVDDIIRATRPTPESRELMTSQARALRSFDGSNHAAKLRCPALCMAGAEDTLTGVDEVQSTAALLPNARSVVIPNAGHTLLLESANVFDLVCQFVTE